jgi:hypothetical protein
VIRTPALDRSGIVLVELRDANAWECAVPLTRRIVMRWPVANAVAPLESAHLSACRRERPCFSLTLGTDVIVRGAAVTNHLQQIDGMERRTGIMLANYNRHPTRQSEHDPWLPCRSPRGRLFLSCLSCSIRLYDGRCCWAIGTGVNVISPTRRVNGAVGIVVAGLRGRGRISASYQARADGYKTCRVFSSLTSIS